LYYLGIESGSDPVLANTKKGVTADELIRVANKANDAEVPLSTMILLGLGNRDLSDDHARGSARVVSAIQPKFLSTLVVIPVEGTPLWDDARQGKAVTLTPVETAIELRTLIANTNLDRTIFRSNHASNYLALSGILDRDRERFVAALDQVISDPENARFVPEWLRGL